MNSELEKLIEKYRITVNGLADLESGYDEVIKERGFVTLNGLLAGSPSADGTGEGTENAVNTENTPVADETATTVESDASHNEPTPVVPAPSTPAPVENPSAPVENPGAPVENPGVTPVTESPVSNDTNLGTEVAASSTDGTAADAEDSTEEDPASTEDNSEGTPRKPKKKKN